MSIHATAIVSDDAVIGAGCSIGAFSIIESGVVLEENCHLAEHVILRAGTKVGANCRIDSFAVIGGLPQSIGFDPAVESGVLIGRDVVIREGVTVHRATEAGGFTAVGDRSMLMAQAHVAHDCEVEEDVILANNVMLGGHVSVGTKVFLGGGSGVHQFCRIGPYAMLAANSIMTYDVPPYVMAAERNSAHGLNLVGLRRAKFEQGEISDLKRCYRAVFLGGGNLKRKAAAAAREHEFGRTVSGARFLNFFDAGTRGFIRSTKEGEN